MPPMWSICCSVPMGTGMDESVMPEGGLERYVICPQCHTLHQKAPLPVGQRARCRECGTILYRYDPRYLIRAQALAVTGMILFLVANLFPLVQIDLIGHQQYVSILEAIHQLYASGFYVVAVGVAFMVLIIPAMVMINYFVAIMLMRRRKGQRVVHDLLVRLAHLLPWSMVDIFTVSILVALVKLRGEVSIHMGLSFWALLLYVGIDLYLTKAKRLGYLWELYGRIYSPPTAVQDATHSSARVGNTRPEEATTQKRLIRCPVCEAVNVDQGGAIECHRCRSRIYRYPRYGVGRTWALLITAMILYIPANVYPVLEVKNILGHSSNTIIGGVIVLWDQGSYPIAIILFLASVLVPVLKFILLLYLLISVHYPVAESKATRHRMHALIEAIGSWSMMDVFVVTVLTGLVKYERFTILAGSGATAFVLMVFFTMLAALSFDPRLIQEDPGKRRQHEFDTPS